MHTNVREQTQHQMYEVTVLILEVRDQKDEQLLSEYWNFLQLLMVWGGGESLKICLSDIPDAILYRNIQSAKPVNSSWKKEEVPLSCLPEVLDDQATDNVLFGKNLLLTIMIMVVKKW